jgi:hypothetical protein
MCAGRQGRRDSEGAVTLSGSSEASAGLGCPCRRIWRATEKATHSNAQKLIAKARNRSRIGEAGLKNILKHNKKPAELPQTRLQPGKVRF